MEGEELEPVIVSGILKTILLFLEGQNFCKTCETFLWETSKLGYPTIRSATAQVLILKPAVTETVTVTRACPNAEIRCRLPSSIGNLDGVSKSEVLHKLDGNDGPSDKSLAVPGERESTSLYDASDLFNHEEKERSYEERRLHSDFISILSLASTRESIQPAVEGEEENSCFPCEECNDLTPISSTSIPNQNVKVEPNNSSKLKDDTQEKANTKKSMVLVSGNSSERNDVESSLSRRIPTSSAHMPSLSALIDDQHATAPSFPGSIHDRVVYDPPMLTVLVKRKSQQSCPDSTILDDPDASNRDLRDFQIEPLTETNSTSSYVLHSAPRSKTHTNTSHVQFNSELPTNTVEDIINDIVNDVTPRTSNVEMEMETLDYNRLKNDLNRGSVETRLLLLQALRWKITKATTKEKDKILIDIAKYDLLGLHGNACGTKLSLLKSNLLVEDHPSLLQEGMARLLNAMASGTIGRDYLCQDDRTLRFTIIPLVRGKHPTTINDVTREHLLVTLQKLSLRSKMRVVMIESGLPEYLVEYLSANSNKVSVYCLEYTCALFMNLCLHKETRQSMHQISNCLLSMLSQIIRSSNIHCLPYINGAMYSLFNDVTIRQQARNSSLYNILLKRAKQFDGDIKQQFELIVKVLNDKEILPPCVDCGSVNEDIEIDHIEAEIDTFDTVNGTPNGNELLKSYESDQQGRPSSEKSLQCLCTPVAPPRKITVKSFCSGGHENSNENKLPSLDVVLSTVAEIDRDIQQSHQSSALCDYDLKINSSECDPESIEKPLEISGLDASTQEPNSALAGSPKPDTKDEMLTAKCPQKNKGTQNNSKSAPPTYKHRLIRDRYDPTPPFLYEPKPQCPCIAQDRKNQDQNNKYRCGCYMQMQKFVENHCSRCGCPPSGRNLDVKVLFDGRLDPGRKNKNEDLFQSAIELLALSCCKSDVSLPTHVDCECYSTVFRSRPKVKRTP